MEKNQMTIQEPASEMAMVSYWSLTKMKKNVILYKFVPRGVSSDLRIAGLSTGNFRHTPTCSRKQRANGTRKCEKI
ncbi:hypothetical protein DWB84_02480 [Saccharophagus sp. K07]|jgi:hypothetical protein|nr:hypothetical protein [Saccharophagus sp. K07]